jgi:glycosyltransferase involved in cell wall biosynthesis
MLHIHILYDVPGWAYWARAQALAKYAPADLAITSGACGDPLPAADVVVLLAYGACAQVRQEIERRTPRPKLIVGYNVGYGYRRELLATCQAAADVVVLNNRDNWERCGRPPGTVWISNGVDRDVFRPRVPCARRPCKIISCGSQYHLRCNADLKGLRSHLEPLAGRLSRRRLACEWLLVNSVGPQRKTREEMVAWYNAARVYVVASSCEGTPNPALEAAACGCVVVATRVGNMPELIENGVNGLLVERTVDALEAGVLAAVEHYERMAPAMLARIASWDWRVRAEQYYALFRQVAADA